MFRQQFLYSVLFLMGLSIEAINCDKICESLIPDAITSLRNGSIVVFREKEVWLFNRKENQLSGPCPINRLYKDMSGPIDAAITFHYYHKSDLTEFTGTSIFFGEGNFYTFKNMRPYQVEFGSIIFLPFTGKQDLLGSQSKQKDRIKHLMSKKISAAYFDAITTRSQLIFADNSILSFNFDTSMDAEHNSPEFSTVEEEFKQFGVFELPQHISAAFTLIEKNKNPNVFLFEGTEYCGIEINVNKTDQKCILKPVSDFFNCNNLRPITRSMCSQTEDINGEEVPVSVQTQEPEYEEKERTASTILEQTLKVRDSVDYAQENIYGKQGQISVSIGYVSPLGWILFLSALSVILTSFWT